MSAKCASISRCEQPPAVERQDLVVKTLKPPLALADDPRPKAPVTIARRVDPHRSVLGDQPLRSRAVARVLRPTGWLLVAFIADVIGQLNLKRPFHQPPGQLRQHAARADDLLLSPSARQQLVDDLVRQPSADLIGHPIHDLRPGRRRLA